MRIVTEMVDENDDVCIKYINGDIFDRDNYIRQLVESVYPCEFKHKGFEFNEDVIIRALTIYFDENQTEDINKLNEMFKKHSESKDSDNITEVKRIVIDYVKNNL